MTQAERDRLVALKKAKKKLITQKQAAEELGITERHVRRLLRSAPEFRLTADRVISCAFHNYSVVVKERKDAFAVADRHLVVPHRRGRSRGRALNHHFQIGLSPPTSPVTSSRRRQDREPWPSQQGRRYGHRLVTDYRV